MTLLCQELQQKRAQKASEAERRPSKDRPETRALGQPPPTQEPPLTLGSVTHQAPKTNNASEWFSVYPVLGETEHSAGLWSSWGQACDSYLQNWDLGLVSACFCLVTCGTGLESDQVSTDHPGSGASQLRPGIVGLCLFPFNFIPWKAGGPSVSLSLYLTPSQGISMCRPWER